MNKLVPTYYNPADSQIVKLDYIKDDYIDVLSGRKALILDNVSKRRKEGISDDAVGVKRISD